MLVVVHVSQPTLPEETRPTDVPSSAGNVPEPGHFKRIDNAVVGVCTVRNFETWRAVGFQLLLVILDDAAVVSWKFPLLSEEGWVGEKNVGFTSRKGTLDHGYDLVRRPAQELSPYGQLALLVGHASGRRYARFGSLRLQKA